MALDNNFGEELLHKIKDEKIQPKPRWKFLLKNYFIWSLGIFSLLLGTIAMSLIFFMLRYNDADIYGRAGGQLWEKLLLIIPFFGIVCLIFFIFIVLYYFKHTKKGYRYSSFIILSAVISFSVILGVFFYIVGMGEITDNVLGRNVPFYDKIINPRVDFWSQPESGRLMGLIKSQAGLDEYILIDRNKKEWKVLLPEIGSNSDDELELNRSARFLGKVQSENEFSATEILPVMPPGREFFGRFGNLPPLKSDKEIKR